MTDNPFALPDLGGSDSGELVAWLVEAGETVNDDQPVAEVETEKSVVEVPAPNAGTVTELLVDEGETVDVGAEILRLEADEATRADADDADSAADEAETPPDSTDHAAEEVAVSEKRVFAPPRVRRLARELGVDIATVEGSEASGRISETDVREAAESEDENEQAAGPKPFTPSGQSAVSKDGKAVSGAGVTKKEASETEPGPKPFTPSGQSAVSKSGEAVSAAGMASDTETVRQEGPIAHTTHHDTAVVADLAKLRAELEPHAADHGVELSLLPLVMKAVVRALVEQPTLNAAVDAEGTVDQREAYHIGIAVATTNGLVVPVVRNADEKTILELADEISGLIERAETGELTPAETGDSTFTLTNCGAIGDEYATLPVEGSQTARLGLGTIEPRPVVEDGTVVARETLPLSLSSAPQAVDSTEAAAFVEQLLAYIESPNRLVLEAV